MRKHFIERICENKQIGNHFIEIKIAHDDRVISKTNIYIEKDCERVVNEISPHNSII